MNVSCLWVHNVQSQNFYSQTCSLELSSLVVCGIPPPPLLVVVSLVMEGGGTPLKFEMSFLEHDFVSSKYYVSRLRKILPTLTSLRRSLELLRSDALDDPDDPGRDWPF